MSTMRQICMEIFGTDNVAELRTIARKAKQYDDIMSGMRPSNARGAGRKGKFAEEDIMKMEELYRQGTAISEISKIFQTSRQTIYKYLESELRIERNADVVLRIYYMHDDMLCTIIDVDFRHKKVFITNKTNRILLRAFGVVTDPDWEQFEYFLESRCFPRTRAYAKEILRDLGLDSYDPLQIVEKTQGRMAEDHHWMKFFYKDEIGRM